MVSSIDEEPPREEVWAGVVSRGGSGAEVGRYSEHMSCRMAGSSGRRRRISSGAKVREVVRVSACEAKVVVSRNSRRARESTSCLMRCTWGEGSEGLEVRREEMLLVKREAGDSEVGPEEEELGRPVRCVLGRRETGRGEGEGGVWEGSGVGGRAEEAR